MAVWTTFPADPYDLIKAAMADPTINHPVTVSGTDILVDDVSAAEAALYSSNGVIVMLEVIKNAVRDSMLIELNNTPGWIFAQAQLDFNRLKNMPRSENSAEATAYEVACSILQWPAAVLQSARDYVHNSTDIALRTLTTFQDQVDYLANLDPNVGGPALPNDPRTAPLY